MADTSTSQSTDPPPGEPAGQEPIEALFERNPAGRLPLESALGGPGRSRWLRTVDFTRPTKFSLDQERRLRRVHEGFCRAASTRLAAEHRIPLELDLLEISQLTWADAHGVIPESAMCASLDVQPIQTNLLLGADLALLLVCIERLLGSSIDEQPTPRKLTEIDVLLVRRIFELLVDTLSATWTDMAQVGLELGAIEAQPESRAFTHPSEPCLVLTLEARLPHDSTTMTLVVPYASVEPIIGAISRKEAPEAAEDLRMQQLVRERLSHVDVTMRAEVAELAMDLSEVLALQVGDTLKLGPADESTITLWADGVPVHRARAGRSGGRRAVQVTERLAPEGER
jgi:flagellar motor switch protein FliM